MTRLAELEARISSLDELLDIVGAMRSLAGMRMIEAQRAEPGARRYSGIVRDAVGGALALAPPPDSPPRSARAERILILFGSEHGFVGGFNERLMEAARREEGPRPALLVMGGRAALLAEEQGWPPAWSGVMATRAAGIPEAVRHLAEELYRRIAAGGVAEVSLLHSSHGPGGGFRISGCRLLPYEPPAAAPSARLPPLHGLPPALLLEKLIAEYVFACLVEAAIESLASENAARFEAMESARDALTRRLDQLGLAARQTRQEEITSELLDLIVGSEAAIRP